MEKNPIHSLRYISLPPRTISESNTKEEQALDQIPKTIPTSKRGVNLYNTQKL